MPVAALRIRLGDALDEYVERDTDTAVRQHLAVLVGSSGLSGAGGGGGSFVGLDTGEDIAELGEEVLGFRDLLELSGGSTHVRVSLDGGRVVGSLDIRLVNRVLQEGP